MIDAHAVIRTFLLGDAGLVALVGERLYAGRDTPPRGYKPIEGPCITFKVRGGGPDYEDALLEPSVQFKCYGATEAGSFEVYRALYDALHNGHSGAVLWGMTETLGQPLEEPETGWFFTLGHFTVLLRQS